MQRTCIRWSIPSKKRFLSHYSIFPFFSGKSLLLILNLGRKSFSVQKKVGKPGIAMWSSVWHRSSVAALCCAPPRAEEGSPASPKASEAGRSGQGEKRAQQEPDSRRRHTEYLL